MRRGGHPLFVGRKVGGYIDAWNTPADPGWTLFGTMRYRSRRDLIHMAGDPAFRAVHPAKLLGTAATFSFPAQRIKSEAHTSEIQSLMRMSYDVFCSKKQNTQT